jgi:hypothetical protein
VYLFKRNKIGFHHVPKTAGTSIRHYLSMVLSEEYTILGTQHVPIEKIYNKIPKNMKVFTVIRNPYERLISLYNYRKEKSIRRKKNKGKITASLAAVHNTSFKKWIINWIIPNISKGNGIHQSITNSITINGAVPKKLNVIRMEDNMETSIKSLLKINTNKKIPYNNKSKQKYLKGSYLEHYDSELLSIVYELEKYIFDRYYKEIL